MTNTDRVRVLADELARSTTVLPHEYEALAGTNALQDPVSVFLLMARIELVGARLHKQLVEWHTRFPERPSLVESDAFWAGLKELRTAKEELAFALAAIREREKAQPTLTSRILGSSNEIGDVERYFDSYLDRINPK